MPKALLAFLVAFSTSSLFSQSLCSGAPAPKSPCAGWEALQQIRSLIPERHWQQEFSILVDREAFKKAIPGWTTNDRQDRLHRPTYKLAASKRYYLESTMSGENIRILDHYEKFQFSPYWENPPRIDELHAMERQIIQRSCKK